MEKTEINKNKNVNESKVGGVTTVYRVDAHCTSLCEALYKLTSLEPQFCDVILRLNNSKREFKAHSPVLVTCSAFFKSILTKPENQCAKNVVVLLPDFIRPEGLEPVLLFIYTGDLGINDGNVNSIFQVASLFELSGAISLCHKYVESRKLSLSVLNADQIVEETTDSETKVQDNTTNLEESPSIKPERSLISTDNVADKENCTKLSSENVIQNNASDNHRNHLHQQRNSHDDENDDNDEMSLDENSSEEVNSDGNSSDRSSYPALRPQLGRRGRYSESKTKSVKSNVLPVRRSLRKLASHKRKVSTLSAMTLKNYSTKRKRNKVQIHKVKNWSESMGKIEKMKNEENPRPGNSKIDTTLKFTDPAKYISELIDKNSDMLNEHGTDNESGGIKMITKGKITYIYPEGHEMTANNANNEEKVSNENEQQPQQQANTKINEAGLPYEKIIDPLMCAECNISFPSAVVREEHMQTKHKGHGAHMKQVMFQCLNCPFSTDFLRNMWFHCHWKHAYPLPDTLRQYCCGLCDYRAPAQGNIEVHIRRVHTNERPLMCDVCGQFFKSLDTLRGHRFYRHQDIYPFQCNVCEKQFKRRHKLDVHMRIHMGYKPFTCPDCPYATYTKFNLKDHVRKRHRKELDSTR